MSAWEFAAAVGGYVKANSVADQTLNTDDADRLGQLVREARNGR